MLYGFEFAGIRENRQSVELMFLMATAKRQFCGGPEWSPRLQFISFFAFCKWAPSFYLRGLYILKVDFSIMYCILSNSLDSRRVFILLYETSLSDVPPGRMGWEIHWVSFWRASPSLVRDGSWG